MFQFDEHYTVKKMGEGLMDHIVFTKQSPYPELEIQYGKVQLIEEDDQLRVKFEYEVFNEIDPRGPSNRTRTAYLGKVLIEIMMQELTYVEATSGR